MEEQEIKEGILYLLSHNSDIGDGLGHTLIEIQNFLEHNDIWKKDKYDQEKNKENWEKIKNLLDEMEKEGLIEERHFGEELMGRVDYSSENLGFELIKDKEKELEAKWKIAKE